MKKAIALLLTLCILLGCCPALADLASSFEANQLVLQPIELPRSSTAQETRWRSLSPLANSGIVMFDDVPCTYYQGETHPIFIAEDKGVADKYGNLNKFCTWFMKPNAKLQDVRYSPDGRYAMIFNWKMVLFQMYLFFDPILLDLSTGELILLETYDIKMSRPSAGAVCSAVFSADGQSLYYMVYGNLSEEARCTLHRCDLNTLQTEMLGALTDLTHRSDLCELPDGSLMTINDHMARPVMQGNLVIFHPDTRTMEIKATPHQSIELSDRTLNVQDHRAVMISIFSNTYAVNCFQVFDPAMPENAAMYGIGPDDQPVVISMDEIIAMEQETNIPLELVFCSALSPDGEYALMLVYSKTTSQPQWIMVRLSDMTARSVEGPELDSFTALDATICWQSDYVVVYTNEAQAYTIAE